MTRRSVIRTSLADQDILAIWAYVAADNVSAADKLLRRFDTKFELLSISPEVGERLPSFGNNYRRVIVGNYLIFYQVLDDSVQVIRVLHAARKWEDLL